MRPAAALTLVILAGASRALPQEALVLARESFDSVAPPRLPAGWSSSQRRTPGADDFATAASSARSQPNALLAVNGTLAQWVLSPPWRLPAGGRARLQFWTRRSATFLAGVAVDAVSDTGADGGTVAVDTLRAAGTTGYVFHDLPLAPGPERSVRFRWSVIPESTGSAGTFRIDDLVLAPCDTPEAPRGGSLAVNEIMYSPAPGEPEWVELLNARGDTVNLAGWQLSDAPAGPWRLLASGQAKLPPGGLALVTHDSAALREARGWIPAPVFQVAGFPSLNNDGDLVLLADPWGRLVDSVPYRPSWHTPLIGAAAGRSLERVHPALPSSDPRSWGSSVAPGGATPGAPNSLLARVLPRACALSCAPNPFSPDGDGRDDLLMIRFALPSASGVFSLVLYDVRGRKVRCLADHEPCGPERMVAWDGRDEAGGRAPVGMYIILLEAAPADGSPVLRGRAVAVLALPL